MKSKLIVVCTLILIMFCFMSAASAQDINNDTQITYNRDVNEVSTTQPVLSEYGEDSLMGNSEIDNDLTSIIDDDVLNANPKTFTDLNNLINGNTKTHIYLNCNYTYNPDTDSDELKQILIQSITKVN